MFKLVKATAIVSIVTITAVLVGALRAKFTAVTLGPAGVGIFSQAVNFQQLLISMVSLGMGIGVIKYVAQYKAEAKNSDAARVVSCAAFMQLAVFFVLILFILVFSGAISKFLFSDPGYGYYILICAIGAIFPVLAGTIESTMFGVGNYKAFAKGRSLSSLLSLIPLFIFVATIGAKGGFLYLAASGLIMFTVYYCIFLKNISREIPGFAISFKDIYIMKQIFSKFAKGLILYGGASFAIGILGMVNVILLRSFIIKYFGADANGYYQVVFTLSAYYVAFFTNGLWSYLYAKISSAKDADAYSVELNHAMRFCIFGIVPITAGLFLFRHIIINLLFTNKFSQSNELFATQLFGDLFFMLSYVTGTSLLASARLRAYILFGLAYSACFIGLFLLLHGIFGLKAITVSYLISNIIYFAGIIYYHIKTMSVKIYRRNVNLFFTAIPLCFFIFFLDTGGMLMFSIKITMLIGWLFLLSTLPEKRKIFNIIRNRITCMQGGGNA